MSPRLWWWTSTGHRGAMLRAALGVVLVVALSMAAMGLLGGLSTSLRAELSGMGGELRVRPPSLSLGAIDLSGGVLPGRRLDDAALTTLAALPGVAAARPEAWARVPLTFTGDFVGQRVVSEGALLGVAAEAVGDPPGWDWRPGQDVPVLAPRSLLAVYNGSFAPTNGLPRLHEGALTGLRFTIVAGSSPYGRDRRDRVSLTANVIGTTSYGGELAAIVPLTVVRWIEEQAGADDPGRLSGARLVLEPDADPSSVEAAIRAQGWAVEQGDQVMEKLAALLRSIQLGLGVASAVIAAALLMGVVQLQALLLRGRAEEIRVLRALGLRPASLAAGLAAEVLAGVGLASALGVLSGLGLALLARDRASALLGGWIGLDLRLSVSPPAWALLGGLLVPALFAASFCAPGILRLVRGR